MIRERVISSCPVEHGQGDSGGACIASSSLGTLAIHPRLQFPDQIILFDVPGTVGLWPEFRHGELSFQADGHDGSHELEPLWRQCTMGTSLEQEAAFC